MDTIYNTVYSYISWYYNPCKYLLVDLSTIDKLVKYCNDNNVNYSLSLPVMEGEKTYYQCNVLCYQADSLQEQDIKIISNNISHMEVTRERTRWFPLIDNKFIHQNIIDDNTIHIDSALLKNGLKCYIYKYKTHTDVYTPARHLFNMRDYVRYIKYNPVYFASFPVKYPNLIPIYLYGDSGYEKWIESREFIDPLFDYVDDDDFDGEVSAGDIEPGINCICVTDRYFSVFKFMPTYRQFTVFRTNMNVNILDIIADNLKSFQNLYVGFSKLDTIIPVEGHVNKYTYA